MASPKQWFRGCGLGCGGLILLVLLALLATTLVFNVGGSRVIRIREQVESTLGSAEELRLPANGRISADRMERLLAIRRAQAFECAEFTKSAAAFDAMDNFDEDNPAADEPNTEIFGLMGRALGGMFKVTTRLNAYLVRRNQLLLEHEMSLAEYSYLHTMIYYSWLGHEPQPFLLEDDADRARIYWDRVSGEVREAMHRHVLDPEAAQNPDIDLWRAELQLLDANEERQPFAEGLPPGLLSSFEPYRQELEALWCPATDELDHSITEREGPGFEHM